MPTRVWWTYRWTKHLITGTMSSFVVGTLENLRGLASLPYIVFDIAVSNWIRIGMLNVHNNSNCFWSKSFVSWFRTSWWRHFLNLTFTLHSLPYCFVWVLIQSSTVRAEETIKQKTNIAMVFCSTATVLIILAYRFITLPYLGLLYLKQKLSIHSVKAVTTAGSPLKPD